MGISSDQLISNIIQSLIQPFVLLLLLCAVILFIVGVIKFMMNSDNQEERTLGRSRIIWGLIGITIMLGAWGIVTLTARTITSITNEPTLLDR
jgi:predicted tellurium resistance membrane protein TerC